MGIQINGATDTISASDGSLSVTSSESTFGGIATFTNGVNLTGPSLIEVNSSSNALRITQTGSGNVFLAEDQTNPDGSPFVITGSGDVGIGTDNASRKLHIHESSATNTYLQLSNSTTGSGTDDGFQIVCTGSTGQVSLIQRENQPLTFQTNNQERLRINSSGNVGIGTDSPDAGVRLHIEDSSPVLRLNHTGSGTGDILGSLQFGSPGDPNCAAIYALHDGSTDSGALSFRTEVTGGNIEERLHIDSNGRVHIGGNSVPLVNLSINGTGGQGGGIQINRNTSGTGPTNGQSLGSIAFKGVSSANTNAAAEAMIEAIAVQDHSGTAAGTDMVFRTKLIDDGPGSAPAEAIRIRNDGRVINSEGNTVSYQSYRTRFYAYDTNPLIVCEGNGSGYTEGAFLTWAAANDRGGGLYMYNENGASTEIEWYAGRPYAASDQFIIARKSGPTDPGSDTAQVANKLLLLTNGGNMTINGTLTQSGSDDKLKTNRVGLTSALEKVKTLEGFTYNWNDNAINNYGFSADDGTLVGMSAQELQLVLPEAVKNISVDGEVEDPTSGEVGESREYLTIQYERVVPLLVQAIKELSEKNVELEARLATLEGQ